MGSINLGIDFESIHKDRVFFRVLARHWPAKIVIFTWGDVEEADLWLEAQKIHFNEIVAVTKETFAEAVSAVKYFITAYNDVVALLPKRVHPWAFHFLETDEERKYLWESNNPWPWSSGDRFHRPDRN